MQATPRSNPFVMMTDPETILLAVERSERLNRLSRKVYRPLDRPLIPKVGAQGPGRTSTTRSTRRSRTTLEA